MFCIYYLRISTFSLYQQSAMTKIWREVLWIVLNLQWKIKRDLYSVIIWHQRIFFLSSLCGNRNSCEVIKFLMSDRGERERTRTVLLPPKPIYTSTALKCPSSISCSNQGVIIYTNSRSFPRTQQACTSLEYATAQDFPCDEDIFTGTGKCRFKPTQAIKETARAFPASGCISPS